MSTAPFRPSFRPTFVCLLAVASALLIVACQAKTPEQIVTEARAQYVVELNSWFPQEKLIEPVMEDPVATGEEAPATTDDADASVGDAVDMEGEIVMMEPVGPRQVDILLDLIVRFDGQKPLPGITLDISQVNAEGAEKSSWRHFLEIPTIIKTETKQISVTLEDLLFEDGDQFSVTLEKSVDPAERGDYREFALVAGE